jgi:hypothetical protein
VQCIAQPLDLSLEPWSHLVAFAERQVRNAPAYTGPGRRREYRHPLVMPVIGQPIDEHFRPLAAPMAMVTRNLSKRGVCLIHEARLSHDRLALRLGLDEGEAILVGAVRWRRAIGPFYSCGCEIIDKLDSFPADSAAEIRLPNGPRSAISGQAACGRAAGERSPVGREARK